VTALQEPGSYDVTLTASDTYTTISHTKRNFITVVNSPHAEFRADRTKGVTPFNVTFTDLTTGNPTRWKWDFGDGAQSSDKNPTHTYATTGISSADKYTVTLSALNSFGEDTVSKVDYIIVTQSPIAEFTVDSRQGKAPFVVKFRDTSAGNPMRWNWDFGDGTGSSEQNPSHVYPFEGSYDVRLTVSNQYGSDSVFKTGSTSQRGNAAPVPLTTMITQNTNVTPSSEAQANDTATPALPTATQAPLSPFVTTGATVIGILAIAIARRK
jgi:PKD repeat protein